jgi:hypothetical protein
MQIQLIPILLYDLLQCHFVHHKHRMEWSETEPRTL